MYYILCAQKYGQLRESRSSIGYNMREQSSTGWVYALYNHSTVYVVKMAWWSPDSILSKLLSGNPFAILIAFVVSFSIPFLLHIFLYSTYSQSTTTPTFLLLGSSGAGKTSLLTLVSWKGL